MDDRLTKSLEHSNYRFTHGVTRKNLELKFQRDLLYSQNGGTFKVTRELITFVHTLMAVGEEDAILIDEKNKPIHIPDLGVFLEAIRARYFEATNAYFTEYEKLSKARTVKAVAGL